VLLTALLLLFIISILTQCAYAFYFFSRIFNLPVQSVDSKAATLPVSIIICAKDEARNLERNIPLIMAQIYSNEKGKPLYEVIVVNDASEDNTEQVLYHLEQQFTNLWHVTITKESPRNFRGKKFALSKGVSYSTYPYLLLTDADCAPASVHWLSEMVGPLQQDKEIVAGYGGFHSRGGLLNAFIRWETIHTFLSYSSYILAGKPYMAVGRNIACTKEIFLKAQQSEVWNKLPSGDDDLLVQCCGTAINTAIVASPDSFTFSEAKSNWSDWLKQKQRHVSTGKYYKDDIKLLLGGYALSHGLTWLLFFLLIFCSPWLILTTILFFIRCIIYWSLWQTTAQKLQEKKLFLWVPLCDIGWGLYNLLLSPYIIWKNKKQWK
jgi:glycosyltransferase involved in cell wall biosynthesis